MEQKILQAVIQSLNTYPTVEINDMVVLGKVNSFYDGHLTKDELLVGMESLIKEGYFLLKDDNIHITEEGLNFLGLNS